MSVGIGSPVWRFDQNRRYYRRDGIEQRTPIWSLYWRPYLIVGETSRSWVTNAGEKIPKRDPDPRVWCLSLADLQDRAWVQANALPALDVIQHRFQRGALRRSQLQQLLNIFGITPEAAGPFPVDFPHGVARVVQQPIEKEK